MNQHSKNKTETQTVRPLRSLFIEELGVVQGGRDRRPIHGGRDRSPTTRSDMPWEDGGGISE